jgi:hypothetical protein
LFLRALFSLHSGAVESDVPVGKLLKELKHVLDDIVQAVVVHLIPHILDQVLVSGNDPLIHNVGIGLRAQLGLKSGVEYKVVTCGFLPARDILDQEAVSVKPGEENVSHNALNSFSCEFKGLCSHDWGVAEIESAGVSTELMCDEHGIRVVLFALGHLAAVLSQHDAIDNQVLERCNTLNSS